MRGCEGWKVSRGLDRECLGGLDPWEGVGEAHKEAPHLAVRGCEPCGG